MSARRGTLRRVARGVLLALAALLAFTLLSLAALVETAPGRALVLRAALGQLQGRLPGRVEIRELGRLSPFGVSLTGLSLFDPSGAAVLELATLQVELAPAELWHRRLVLRAVRLGPGRVDSRRRYGERLALLAAVSAPDAPEAPASSDPGLAVRVESWVLTDVHVALPGLPAPAGELDLEALSAAGSLVNEGGLHVELLSLAVGVLRAGEPLARVDRLAARLVPAPARSTFAAELSLAAVRLWARGQAVVAPGASAPLADADLQLSLQGVRAPDVARWLDDAALEQAFAGSVGLELALSGDLQRADATASLWTAAGQLDARAELRAQRELSVVLGAERLTLSALRPALPEAELSLSAQASATLGAEAIPFSVALRSGRLGATELPTVSARGTYSRGGLEGLELEARRGASWARARGRADAEGNVELGAAASVLRPELAALAAAAGLPGRPGGRLELDLELGRSSRGALRLRGNAQARALDAPGLSLDLGRLRIDASGPPDALDGSAELSLSRLSVGGVNVPAAELRAAGHLGRFRLRGHGQVDRLRAAFELHGARTAEGLRVSGQAEGHQGDVPFALRAAPTTIEGRAVETAGISLTFGGQRLEISGGHGRPGAELLVQAPTVDLGAAATLLGLGSGWRGRGGLRLRASGSIESPLASLVLDLQGVGRAGTQALDAQVSADLDAVRGESRLKARLGGGRVGSRASLDLVSTFAGGRGWEARLAAARHQGTLELEDVSLAEVGRWRGAPLPVAGTLSLAASVEGPARTPRLQARLGGTLREVAGSAWLGLAHRLEYADGRLSSELGVADERGPWLAASVALALAPEHARDLTRLTARAEAALAASRVEAQVTAAQRPLGALWTSAPESLAGLILGAELGLSRAPGAEPQGRASLRARGDPSSAAAGACQDRDVELELDAALGDGRLETRLRAARRGVELLVARAAAELGLRPEASGGLRLGRVDAELTSRGLRLEQLPYVCQRVRGRLDARVTAADVLGAAPTLAARIDARGLSLGAEPRLSLALEGRADGDDARASLRLEAPGGHARLQAALPISWSSGRLALAAAAPLAIEASLTRLPIAPLLDPSGAVSHARGVLSGAVTVGGTLAAPAPSGQLELSEGELTATALAQPLHDVRARLRFTRDVLEIERFQARDRDGVLRASGRIARSGLDALRVALDVSAESFPLRQLGQVVATTSARASIAAELSRRRSSVQVELRDADTWLEKVQARSGIDLRPHPDFVLAGADDAQPPPADEAGRAPPDDEGFESHITLDATEHFWIKREDFAIQLSARLEAELGRGQTKVTGRVEIRRGYLDLMGRVFDVERGSHLIFTGASSPDPVVAITARYQSRSSGRTVEVRITGRGSKPELAFHLDGAQVSAGEALEEVAFRRGSGKEDSASADAASFVSGLTAGLLATSARRELGAAAPILMIEPGKQTGDGRIRAGFELDQLVPRALRDLITGVYVEGIVQRESAGQESGQSQTSTQAGVLLELYFPHQLFTTGQWGPGTTWSLDWGWQL